MPQMTSIVRRRRQRRNKSLSASARVGALLLVILPVAFGAVSLSASRLYLELTQQVPAVEDIEAFFEDDGFMPSIVVDRNGDQMQTLQNPTTFERDWVGLSRQSDLVAPDLLIRALLLEQDPTYWDNPGYLPDEVATAIIANLFGNPDAQRQLTITEQVVAATLLPLEQHPAGNSLRRNFRTALLAERLNQRFDKGTILEWYLNLAYFGHHIYGVDSAALAYFGKHVDGLTLAEIAVLAAVAGDGPQILESATATRQAQREVLTALQRAGEISQRQVRAARAQPLAVRNLGDFNSFPKDTAIRLALTKAEETFGSAINSRGGLTIKTTLDLDLQQQSACLLATQIERLGGASANANVATEGGSPCLASGLLPPVRPSDLGVDRQVDAGTLVVMDSALGEIRAYVASAAEGEVADAVAGHRAGELIHPYIYLTAFSRGFSPGSMIFDLPSTAPGMNAELMDGPLSDFQGPVQMRQALRTGLLGAAVQTVELAGLESVNRTLQEFGLTSSSQSLDSVAIIQGDLEIEPVSMAFAYSTLANEGVMIGQGNGTIRPIILGDVEDRFGRGHLVNEPQRRAILSQGLTFLVNDVLRDSARRNLPGEGTVSLGLDQPAASASTHQLGDKGSWTIGYTPKATIVAWYGNLDESRPVGLTAENSTAPTVAAMLRYATRQEPAQDWLRPNEVSRVKICSPSGLLPTTYCPQVVDEIFLQGTEPTSFDNLYQPFRLNRETGNLATLATPLELIEERVYLVPPPEASSWAQAVGLQLPPSEYDPLPAVDGGSEVVNIETPEPFAVLRGEVEVLGDAHPSDFEFYRIQVGAGLNPTRWIQIGEDRARRVWGGSLVTWDTEALSGLYTLQLVVVLENGQIRTASVPVTVDNVSPSVRLLQPDIGEEISADESIQVEVIAEDLLGVEEVQIELDGRVMARLKSPPYITQLEPLAPGRYQLVIQAIDQAGNQSEIISRTLVIKP